MRKVSNKEANRKPKALKSGKEKPPLIAYIDHEKQVCINLDKSFKWTQPLTDGQRLFIFYYVNQTMLKKNAAEAARLAGYSQSRAKVQGAEFLRNPQMIAEIENIQSQFLKNVTFCNLKSAVQSIIESKIKRLQVNPLDYYEIEEHTTDEGFTFTRARPKTPENFTEEQKANIIDVEFVGQRGLLHYKLADKTQAENELIKLVKDLKDSEEQGKDFDVEATAEIIGEKVQLKTKIMKANKETAEMSELSAIGALKREEED